MTFSRQLPVPAETSPEMTASTTIEATTEHLSCDCHCLNGGICLKFAKIESFCFCPSKYYGKYCEKSRPDGSFVALIKAFSASQNSEC